MIIWLTGLPCSGKTTIARALVGRLDSGLGGMETGRLCELLDGDDLRGSAFGAGAGFSPAQRGEHLLRVGYLAGRLSNHVPYVICAFVSPEESVRAGLPIDLLVYVRCPVDICERRDIKGMYRKARRGEIENFTGVSAPYQAPKAPDVTVNTDIQSPRECVDAILAAIKEKAEQ